MHHLVHFFGYHMFTKFQFHCSITCRDILYFVFGLPYCHTLWRHQYLICVIQKSWISLERDAIWQKGKRHSSSLLKTFQIRLFFNTSIFHFIGTLSPNYVVLLGLGQISLRHLQIGSKRPFVFASWTCHVMGVEFFRSFFYQWRIWRTAGCVAIEFFWGLNIRLSTS